MPRRKATVPENDKRVRPWRRNRCARYLIALAKIHDMEDYSTEGVMRLIRFAVLDIDLLPKNVRKTMVVLARKCQRPKVFRLDRLAYHVREQYVNVSDKLVEIVRRNREQILKERAFDVSTVPQIRPFVEYSPIYQSVQFAQFDKAGYFSDDIIQKLTGWLEVRTNSKEGARVIHAESGNGCWYKLIIEHTIPMHKIREILLEIDWVVDLVSVCPTTETLE